jgi:hypothetical protein
MKQLEGQMSTNKAVGNVEALRDTRTAPRPVAVGTQRLHLTAREVWLGALAGFGGGITMGLMAIIVSLSHGLGPWTPFNDVAGALFPGILSRTGAINVQTIIAGIVIHFTISVLLGMLFTAIYSGLLKLTFDFGVPITMGLAYSWVIWMVVRFVFLPLLGSGVYGVPAFIIAHGVYGVTLGFLYPLLRNRRIGEPVAQTAR